MDPRFQKSLETHLEDQARYAHDQMKVLEGRAEAFRELRSWLNTTCSTCGVHFYYEKNLREHPCAPPEPTPTP